MSDLIVTWTLICMHGILYSKNTIVKTKGMFGLESGSERVDLWWFEKKV